MNKTSPQRHQFSTPRASLCVLGEVMKQTGVLQRLEQVKIRQKTVRYSPHQKLSCVLVGMLSGASTIKDTDITLGTDQAVQRVLGLDSCPDQSVLQDTLDAASQENVNQLREASEELFVRYSPTVRRLAVGQRVWVDVDLTPLPASAHAEGSERGYMGRERSKTGRKLLRVRTAPEQEVVYEKVVPGKAASGLELLQQAVTEMERVLNLATEEQRERVVIRLDSGFGGEATHRWVLERSYQLLGKMKSGSRVRKLCSAVSEWLPTSSPGRQVGEVNTPIDLGRPTHQYAVRTPSHNKPEHYSVLVSSLEMGGQEAVEAYDGRAGIENDFKGDKQGLGLRARRKRKLVAQEMVVLLSGLAHNILVWARRWLSKGDSRLGGLGIVRLVREVWCVPGRVTFRGGQLTRVRLARSHPLGRQVRQGLKTLLGAVPIQSVTLGYLG